MKLIVKGLLVLIAIPVVVVGGAFGYGIVAGLMNPEAFQQDAGEAPSGQTAMTAQVVEGPAAPDSASTALPAVSKPLPEELDPLPENPAAFMEWLESQGIVVAKDGSLLAHPELMARVDWDLALQTYEWLKTAGKGSREERLLWFALCAHQPVEDRRNFLQETDAILPKSLLGRSRGYVGDYALLLNYLGSAFEAPYREAVHLYGEVMSEEDVLNALRQIRAYEIPGRMDAAGTWTEHVEKTMNQCDPETLMLFSDKISGSYLNYNKRMVKMALKKLADKKLADEK